MCLTKEHSTKAVILKAPLVFYKVIKWDDLKDKLHAHVMSNHTYKVGKHYKARSKKDLAYYNRKIPYYVGPLSFNGQLIHGALNYAFRRNQEEIKIVLNSNKRHYNDFCICRHSESVNYHYIVAEFIAPVGAVYVKGKHGDIGVTEATFASIIIPNPKRNHKAFNLYLETIKNIIKKFGLETIDDTPTITAEVIKEAMKAVSNDVRAPKVVRNGIVKPIKKKK